MKNSCNKRENNEKRQKNLLDAFAERDVYTEPAEAQKQPTAAKIEAWWIAQISGRSGMAPDDIDIREPFVYHGLNSKQVVSMTRELEILAGAFFAFHAGV